MPPKSTIEWPTDECIVACLVEYGTVTLYASALGVSRASLASHMNRRGLKSPQTPRKLKAKPPNPGDKVSREEILEAEVKELRSRHAKRRTVDVQAERVLAEVRAAVDAPQPRYEPGGLDPNKRPSPHVHNLLFSDTHYGEVVDSAQVAGVNEYDVDVCKRRIAGVHKALQSFVAHRDYTFEELVISCLGDMVSGGPGIHDEIRESNELTAAEQGYEFGIVLGKFVEELVPLYPKIRVLGVAGNHPRMARPHASKNVFDNFDWMAYKTAETYLRNYPTVTCKFPKAGVLIEPIVAGRNAYLFHGDGIRSTMPGVPWGGVVRRVNEVRKQFVDLDPPVVIHQFQLGHFHSPNVVPGVLMNGALTGTNEYGLKNFGGGAAPTQLLATWNPRKKRMTDVSFVTPA